MSREITVCSLKASIAAHERIICPTICNFYENRLPQLEKKRYVCLRIHFPDSMAK